MVQGNTLIGAGADGLYNQYGCGIQINDHPKDEDGGEYVTALGTIWRCVLLGPNRGFEFNFLNG